MILGYLLVFLLFSLLVLLGVKWYKVVRYWEERGVPHENHHPLLGSLTFLQKENPTFWMRRLYKKFDSPYVGIWLFWKPALVVNTPELARRILVKDAENFKNRFLGSGRTDPIGGLGIFQVNEPLWSSVRRRLTSVFTASKLRNLDGLVKEKTHDLIERYTIEMTKNPGDINVRVINSDFTTDVIGEAAFGVQSQATKTGYSVIRKVTMDFMTFSIFRGLSWSSIFFCPSLVDVFRFSFFPKDTTLLLKKLFRTIVDQRGGYDKPVKEPRDLLDALLKMRQEAASQGEETLRKFPPMAWLDRIATNDYQIDGNLTVPAGTPVYVNGAGMMMDPEYYPDPEVFDPERFMPENEKNIKPYTYLAFGEGPRNCIGMRFAYVQIRHALSATVLNFEIREPPGAIPPNKWPSERRGLLYVPDGKVSLLFTPRN